MSTLDRLALCSLCATAYCLVFALLYATRGA